MQRLQTWALAAAAFEDGLEEARVAGREMQYLSLPGNRVAEAFRQWVNQWAVGTILDVGCGPQEVPLYLLDIPDSRITGIDPIMAPHPFRFVPALIEEYDGEADTVICATSLDHFADVELAAKAMRRIAQQRIILWHCGNAPTPPEEHSWHVDDDDVIKLFNMPRARDGDFYVFQR